MTGSVFIYTNIYSEKLLPSHFFPNLCKSLSGSSCDEAAQSQCVCMGPLCACAELEATRCQLLNSEREKSRLASLAQQHLEDGERLNR